MKLLVFGCEWHVFNLLERLVSRHNPPTPAISADADCGLEALLRQHHPTHIMTGSDELAEVARRAVASVGLAAKVQPFRTPPWSKAE